MVLDLEAGGLERIVADLVRDLDPDRFEPFVICLRGPGRHAEDLAPRVTVAVVRETRMISLVWPRRLVEAISRIRPSVVHSHSGVWLKAARAAHLAGVPTMIHTDHGRRIYPDPAKDRLSDWWASRRTDVVVAVSDALGAYLKRSVVRHPDRVRVIVNGIHTERFAPGADDGTFRARLGIGAREPVLGTVGRFDPIKGYDVMLKAFRLLLARPWAEGESPVLILAGEGPEEARLRALAQTLGIAARVRFTGWLDQVIPLLRMLSLFTLSSYNEGTSISLLEAMSVGCCPVVTAVGGNPAVLGPGLAHRLVRAGDEDALGAAWAEALTHPERRQEDARTARDRVVRAFDWHDTVRAYEDLYEGRMPARA